MQRYMVLGSAALATTLSLGTAHAATPVTAGAVADPVTEYKVPAVLAPATTCLSDVRTFSAKIQVDGYWMGGSAFGYGYPIDGYGYGYPLGGYPVGGELNYQTSRPGYEVRTLLAAANILAHNGQARACEDVLATTHSIYQRYAGELHRHGWAMADGATWQKQQLAAAVPITDKTVVPRSAQLIDSDVRNLQNDALGSVHDLVTNPKTGKIAYLIIGRGGIFGIDEKYVPVPWDDFKLPQNLNMVVLDATRATMDAAPQVTDAQFTTAGQFGQYSQKVDTYWAAHLPAKVSN